MLSDRDRDAMHEIHGRFLAEDSPIRARLRRRARGICPRPRATIDHIHVRTTLMRITVLLAVIRLIGGRPPAPCRSAVALVLFLVAGRGATGRTRA